MPRITTIPIKAITLRNTMLDNRSRPASVPCFWRVSTKTGMSVEPSAPINKFSTNDGSSKAMRNASRASLRPKACATTKSLTARPALASMLTSPTVNAARKIFLFMESGRLLGNNWNIEAIRLPREPALSVEIACHIIAEHQTMF